MLLLAKTDRPISGPSHTRKIADLTFGIYFIHPVIIEISDYMGLKTISFNPIVSVPLITVSTFAVSLFFAWIISRIGYLRRIV
jgi:surface polysaccharide O-acyltransferase-like enzyme